MENIDRVTTFIRSKYPDQITPHFHHTDEGLNYYLYEEDAFWRVVNYIDSITFNSSDDLGIIESTGTTFGYFQTQLSNFDGSVLYETIPDFHNTKKRLDTIMPEMSMYDFADAVRFIANTAVEDESDTSKVFFDTAKFRAFAKGFIGETIDSLEAIEINNLVHTRCQLKLAEDIERKWDEFEWIVQDIIEKMRKTHN